MNKRQFADWVCENASLNDLLDALSELTLNERPQPEEVAEVMLNLLSDEGFKQIKEMYEIE